LINSNNGSIGRSGFMNGEKGMVVILCFDSFSVSCKFYMNL